MKKWWLANSVYVIGALVGALAGYLYYQQIGCTSGTCAITSKPVNSTLYFAMMGGLVGGLFKADRKDSGKSK